MKKNTVKKNTAMKKIEFEQFMKEHTKLHHDLNKSLAELHKKTDDQTTQITAINNVQVNGRKGLQESLQDIYLVTKDLRTKRKMKDAFNEWKTNTPSGRLYSTKIGKGLTHFMLTFISLSALHAAGILSTTPIQLIADVLKFIKEFIM